MRQFLSKIQFFFETLPEQLYPFRQEIEGKLVRGKQAYLKAFSATIDKYQKYQDKVPYSLLVYRGLWHVVGATILVFGVAFFTTNNLVFYSIVGFSILCIALQEFLLHPKRYNQPFSKGIFDLATWVIPVCAYMLLAH